MKNSGEGMWVGATRLIAQGDATADKQQQSAGSKEQGAVSKVSRRQRAENGCPPSSPGKTQQGTLLEGGAPIPL